MSAGLCEFRLPSADYTGDGWFLKLQAVLIVTAGLDVDDGAFTPVVVI